MNQLQEAAERWFRFVEDDIKMAVLGLQAGLYAQTCFHAQQATEKALKGLIAYQGQVPPKIHGLLHLWGLLQPNPLSDMKEEIGFLNMFYAPTRYPDTLPSHPTAIQPSREMAERALQLAQIIYQRIRSIVYA